MNPLALNFPTGRAGSFWTLHPTAKPNPSRRISVVFWGWIAPSAANFPGQYVQGNVGPGKESPTGSHTHSPSCPATTSADPKSLTPDLFLGHPAFLRMLEEDLNHR